MFNMLIIYEAQMLPVHPENLVESSGNTSHRVESIEISGCRYLLLNDKGDVSAQTRLQWQLA